MDSIWTDGVTLPAFPTLQENIQTDAAVIGGGMAGLLTAYFLQKRGLRAVVLEAGRIASGQTSGTTAKITSQHGLIYSRLYDNLGKDVMQGYAAAHESAIRSYAALVEDLGIDCDFERRPAYLYTKKAPEILKREQTLAEACGVHATFRTKSELPFPVAGALRYENQASFHPLKFLRAVADRLEIYENTRVLRVEEGLIETERARVQANSVVFACHYPFVNVPGFYFARMHQERSYVLALEHAAALQGMYYGIDPDGYSFRPVGRYLLLGGGNHRAGENDAGGAYQELRAAAERLFPGVTVARQWSAQDCMTPDGIPYIGRFAASTPNWYVATGFGKWGMTSSMVSARLISDLICDGESPHAAVFDPGRIKITESARALAAEMAHAVRGLTKGAFHIPQKTLDSLPMGHGGVIEFEGQRAGVYRDEQGEVYAVSVRCPHLGCELAWNPDEKSWDCPCHGSRFDYRGRLLNDPAQTDTCL